MSDQAKSSSSLRTPLVIAAVQLGGALLLTLAREQGLIDGDTTTRGVMVLIGLGMAAWGNRMPKALEGPPPASIAIAAVRQAVQRVGGWAMTLAGVAFAGLWMFAPYDVAAIGCMVVVGVAMAIVIGTIVRKGIALRRSSPY